MTVLAIDPGNIESAWCLIDRETLAPVDFAKDVNESVRRVIRETPAEAVVIERLASYGMAVGREVLETCEWVGRFTESSVFRLLPVEYVYRREVKLHICGDSRAKDSNIRRALIDRFARHDLKNGKGTAKNPDWFYGFTADVWQAYAAGITDIEADPAHER